MATTVFTGAQIQGLCYGRIDPMLTTTTQLKLLVAGASLHCTITGTDASLAMVSGGTQPLLVSIDGGAYTQPVLSAGSLPLFTGLADAAHTVDAIYVTGYSNTSITAATALTVTGAAPAIAADVNYGPTFIARSGQKIIGNVPTGTNAIGNGPALGSTAYLGVPSNPSTGGGVQGCVMRVRGRCERIYVLTDTTSRWIVLEKDGTRTAAVLTSGLSVGAYRWVLVATGLDDGVEHEWTLVAAGNAGNTMGFDMVMLGGANASVSSTLPSRRNVIMAIGDSITAGVDGGAGAGTSTGGDSSLTWGYKLANLLGRDVWICGRAGTLITTGAAQIAHDLQVALQNGCNPTHVVALYGRNNTASSQATVTADYTAMIQAALNVPGWTGNFVACLCPPVNAWTNNATVNAGIIAAVASFAGNPRVAQFDGRTPNDLTANDGTHWDIASHALFGTRLYNSGLFAVSSGGGGGGGGGRISLGL